MNKQEYSSHVRYYPPHHFVFYPIVLALLFISVRFAILDGNPLWWVTSGIIVLVGWLSYMVRQHYALTIQNRVVRLEMRYRYYLLTQKAFEPVEMQLSFGQIAALRFAPDAELPALIEKTLSENLSPSKIKKSITNWLPDHMRV